MFNRHWCTWSEVTQSFTQICTWGCLPPVEPASSNGFQSPQRRPSSSAPISLFFIRYRFGVSVSSHIWSQLWWAQAFEMCFLWANVMAAHQAEIIQNCSPYKILSPPFQLSSENQAQNTTLIGDFWLLNKVLQGILFLFFLTFHRVILYPLGAKRHFL